MSCVLRIFGEHFDVDKFLEQSSLSAISVFHRGEPCTAAGGPINNTSGMNISISVREFSDLGGQIEDAIHFLNINQAALSSLRQFPGIERIELDFPVQGRDVFVQSDWFPPRLLLLMGQQEITLTISRYPIIGE